MSNVRIQPGRACKKSTQINDGTKTNESESIIPSLREIGEEILSDFEKKGIIVDGKFVEPKWERIKASEASAWQLGDMAKFGFIPKERLDKCVENTPLSSNNNGGTCNVCGKLSAWRKCIVCNKYACGIVRDKNGFVINPTCMSSCPDRCGDFCETCHHFCWGC